MNKVHKVALAITIIGALNWGVAGIFRFDVVAQMAGGSAEPLARFVYLVIGISGLFNLGLLFKNWHEEDKIRMRRHEEDQVRVSRPEEA